MSWDKMKTRSHVEMTKLIFNDTHKNSFDHIVTTSILTFFLKSNL